MADNKDVSSIHSEGDSDLTISGIWLTTIAWLGGTLALVPIFFASELHLQLGLAIFTEQGMAFALGLALAIVFIKSPIKLGSTKTTVPFFDSILALLGLGAGLYGRARQRRQLCAATL